MRRARFYLDKAAGYAATPADAALITGLASALDALVRADVNARQVLGEAMSAVDDDVAARFAASPPTEEGT